LMVWFPEPDTSQHAYGVDSPEAREMYSLADAQLDRILTTIDVNGATPDIFIVSDHGYSTIDEIVDVQAELERAGFAPDQDDRSVIVAENGGSVLLYTPSANEKSIGDLLDWLAVQRWVGAIATDLPNSSSLKFASISDIGLNGPRSPHIVVTMRSSATNNPAPLARSGGAASGTVGVGSHGGSSPSELHNTLIASGPSFATGIRSEIPSGNIDVVPTILAILGIQRPEQIDGRVLSEALLSKDSRDELTGIDLPSNCSGLSVTTVTHGGTTYLCEFG
jgi:arylsulfatase A-like enzyme